MLIRPIYFLFILINLFILIFMDNMDNNNNIILNEKLNNTYYAANGKYLNE